ncbi:Multi antimicrobial extrusion protein [Sesbania bispinosa]|nr:Multi antimicrobial extrusion protein [Sesbania bispinosa]
MREDCPTSAPLLSHYDNSILEGSSRGNELAIDNDCESTPISEVMKEVKKLYIIALPMIITGLLIYGKSAISIHFLGKIGKEALSGGCLAIGLANITGYSLISGLAAGMEVCIPISILWLNSKTIILLCGQNPSISSIATTYLTFSLPDLLFQSIINPLKIYMRTQNVTIPLMFSAAWALIFHAFINYVIAHHFDLGIRGIALASAFTDLNLLITLLLYLWFSKACFRSWQGWSFQCFKQWKPILHQAIPSCICVCLEWWWYELLIMFSGLLTNAADTIATIGIIIQATSLMYNFPFALSMAVSTRVGIIAMIFMVATRNSWGCIFTKDKATLSLLSTSLPIVGLCEMGNCPQTIICGVLRGSARPALAANINLVSFYVVGLPIAILMGFWLHLGLLGLLLGLLAAQVVCAIMMTIVLARIDWKVQANRAKDLTGRLNVSNEENNECIEGLTTIVFPD